MEITYDKDADAMYIRFGKGEFGSNKIVDRETIVNLDKKGNILGIEFLSVSKRVPLDSFSEISIKNLVKMAA
ncbi:MAG: DUF2283 domain-containing protein [Nanoarchaeota archaeon]|nr:DUF2283 domain-containing protein [Nanoarchaeota archaeon]